MKKPKISVLLPIYKTAPYLKEAVDSILSQTYSDFELITLNDCSPDNAEEILDEYHDERIVRYLGKENVGLANILNTGIEMSRGEYIARMDSDDISLPDRFATQIDYLESHKDVDLVSCGMQLFGSESRTIAYKDKGLDDVKFRSFFYTPVLHASSIWRKKSFADKHLTFDQDMVPAEDYDLWNRALLNGLDLKNIPNVMYMYRIFEGQATSNNGRVASAVEGVKTRYFKSIFPDEADSIINALVNLEHCYVSEPKTMEQTLDWLIKTNQETRYFEQKRLKQLAGKQCCTAYYAYSLTNGIQLYLLPRMGLRYSVKLIKNGIFGNHSRL